MASNGTGQDYSLGDNVLLDGPAPNPRPVGAISRLTQSMVPPTANSQAINSSSLCRDWLHRQREGELAAAQQEEAYRVLGSPYARATRSSGILSPRNSSHAMAAFTPVPFAVRSGVERAEDTYRMPTPARPRAQSGSFSPRARQMRRTIGSCSDHTADSERTLCQTAHSRSSSKAAESLGRSASTSTASRVTAESESLRHIRASNAPSNPPQTVYDWSKRRPNGPPTVLNPNFKVPPGTRFANGRFEPDPEYPDDETTVSDSIPSEPSRAPRPRPAELVFVPRHNFTPDGAEVGFTAPGSHRSRKYISVNRPRSWIRSQPLEDPMTQIARAKLRQEGPWSMGVSNDRGF